MKYYDEQLKISNEMMKRQTDIINNGIKSHLENNIYISNNLNKMRILSKELIKIAENNNFNFIINELKEIDITIKKKINELYGTHGRPISVTENCATFFHEGKEEIQ